MSFKLKSSVPTDGVLYSDFLLQLEENPSPETLQRLYLKIDQLEEKLFEQAKLAQCKELEIHNDYGEKKGQWILKYLEIKAQLASFKAFHKEKQTLWEQDNSNLLKVIKCLFKALEQSEAKALSFLKYIQQDLAKMTKISETYCSKDRNMGNEKHIWKKPGNSERSPSEDLQNLLKEDKSEANSQEMFQTPKQDFPTTKKLSSSAGKIFAKLFSPSLLPECENVLNHIFKTPKVEGLDQNQKEGIKPNENRQLNFISQSGGSVASSEFGKHSTPQNLPSDISLLMINIQDSVRDYIKQLTENSISEQLKFDKDIKRVMDRVASAKKDLEKECDLSFGFSNKKPKGQSSVFKENFTPFQKSKNRHLPSYSMSNQLLSEIDLNIPQTEAAKYPKRTSNYSIYQKGTEESYRMGKKVLDKSLGPKPQDLENCSSQKQIRKRLDSLQNSLALSEKEALLCMLMENIENNKFPRDVHLDDLLRVSNTKESSIMSGFFPQSVSKLPCRSISSFHCEGSEIKPQPNANLLDNNGYMRTPSVLEWQNNDMEDCSPHFLADKIPQEVDKFTIFTPIAKKRSGFGAMNRPTSPHPGVDIDIDLHNVDMGSFVCPNEDGSHQDVDTMGLMGLNDVLGNDGISPILAKKKCVEQKIPLKYNFPTSVEKEYGRRLGGALDFDDEQIGEFDVKYIKEEESGGTEEYGRLTTAEDTGSDKKKENKKEGKIGSFDNVESPVGKGIFDFQVFSARKYDP